MTFPFPVFMPGGVASYTYNAKYVSTTDASSYTFSTSNIGTAATGRYVVVAVSIGAGSLPSVTGVTIGGNAASIIGAASSNTNTGTVFYGLTVNTGTTADIVVSLSGAAVCCGIATYSLYGLSSTTPVDTKQSSANPGSASVTTSNGGVLIVVAANAGALSTYTWTGGPSEDFDDTIEASTAVSYSGASQTTTGATVSITATRASGSAGSPTMAAASFR